MAYLAEVLVVPPPSLLFTATKKPLDMTLISDDPSLWPLINGSHVSSYLAVASLAAVVYDWGEQDGHY